jgi:putative transposase
MQYDPQKHHRRSIRLKGYDYSQAGLYFITICVQDRACLFGEIVHGKMILNDAGKMVENEWLKIPQRFPNVHLHEYMVMPNHFHAIMEIVGATLVVAQNDMGQPHLVQPQGIAPTDKPKTVGDMVGAFQSIVTVEYIRGVKQLGWTPFNGKLWQRNYWEHIIRDEPSYHRISNYIINNPKNWKDDKFHR